MSNTRLFHIPNMVALLTVAAKLIIKPRATQQPHLELLRENKNAEVHNLDKNASFPILRMSLTLMFGCF